MATLIGVHGDSGHGKTGLLGSFALWLRRKFPGAVSRLISADNTESIEPYIDAGLIELWPIQGWKHTFELLDKASKGYWPENPLDPKSKLIAPSDDLWHRVKLMMWEGGSHFSDMLMKIMGDMGGEGIYLGPGTRTAKAGKEGDADLISFKDGDYGVGGNSMTHYNVVQKEMRKYITASAGLPVPQIWTFHTVKAVEDNKPIYGPQLAGKAATAKVQAWFSSLIHAHVEPAPGGGNKYKLFLKEHIDKTNCGPVPFKAVQRIPLPLLDPKIKAAVENKWNEIVPEFLEWTNDSNVAERYMQIRDKMREATKKIIIDFTTKATN